MFYKITVEDNKITIYEIIDDPSDHLSMYCLDDLDNFGIGNVHFSLCENIEIIDSDFRNPTDIDYIMYMKQLNGIIRKEKLIKILK